MITKQETKQLQGMAIIAMLCLHLFCTLTPDFTPLIYITGVPLTYFIGQAADFCVMGFCFCSGYGLYAQYQMSNNTKNYYRGRTTSLFRFIVNYWIILCTFALTALLIGKAKEWLISPLTFFGNAVTLWYSYNGAWWFVSTYIIMVLSTPPIFKLLNNKPALLFFFTAFSYVLGYRVRFSGIDNFWIQHAARLSMSYAELLVGSYFYKYRLMDKIERIWKNIIPSKLSLLLLFIIVTVTIIIRRYIATLFISPISGMIFMISYLLITRQYDLKAKKFFDYMGKHSTNIWLVHMFFYMPQYGGIAYKAKYPLFVFLTLAIISVLASYVIMWMLKNISQIMIMKRSE